MLQLCIISNPNFSEVFDIMMAIDGRKNFGVQLLLLFPPTVYE